MAIHWDNRQIRCEICRNLSMRDDYRDDYKIDYTMPGEGEQQQFIDSATKITVDIKPIVEFFKTLYTTVFTVDNLRMLVSRAVQSPPCTKYIQYNIRTNSTKVDLFMDLCDAWWRNYPDRKRIRSRIDNDYDDDGENTWKTAYDYMFGGHVLDSYSICSIVDIDINYVVRFMRTLFCACKGTASSVSEFEAKISDVLLPFQNESMYKQSSSVWKSGLLNTAWKILMGYDDDNTITTTTVPSSALEVILPLKILIDLAHLFGAVDFQKGSYMLMDIMLDIDPLDTHTQSTRITRGSDPTLAVWFTQVYTLDIGRESVLYATVTRPTSDVHSQMFTTQHKAKLISIAPDVEICTGIIYGTVVRRLCADRAAKKNNPTWRALYLLLCRAIADIFCSDVKPVDFIPVPSVRASTLLSQWSQILTNVSHRYFQLVNEQFGRNTWSIYDWLDAEEASKNMLERKIYTVKRNDNLIGVPRSTSCDILQSIVTGMYVIELLGSGIPLVSAWATDAKTLITPGYYTQKNNKNVDAIVYKMVDTCNAIPPCCRKVALKLARKINITPLGLIMLSSLPIFFDKYLKRYNEIIDIDLPLNIKDLHSIWQELFHFLNFNNDYKSPNKVDEGQGTCSYLLTKYIFFTITYCNMPRNCCKDIIIDQSGQLYGDTAQKLAQRIINNV